MGYRSRFGRGWSLTVGITVMSATMVPAAAEATYPGSNGKIAYIRNDSPTNTSTGKACLGDNIWIMSANGTGQTNINNTVQPFAMGDPAWSPDGKKIAYTWTSQEDVEDTGNSDTLIIGMYNAATSSHMAPVAALPLLDHPAYDAAAFCRDPYGVTWSPDGTKLAIQNYYGLAIIDLANGNAVTHLDPPSTYTYGDVAWAPYGSSLAVGTGAPGFDIATIPTSGKPAKTITWNDVNGHAPEQFNDDDVGSLSRPEWSPDGRTLIVQTGRAGFTNHHRIGFLDPCGGRTLRAVDPNPRGVKHFGYEATWSPDGTKIAFSDTSFVPDPDQVGGEREEQDIWVMNPDGSGLLNLTNTTKVGGLEPFESAPDWQPVSPGPAPSLPDCVEKRPFDVTLKAFAPDGNALDGIITVSQYLDVELTLTNNTNQELGNFEYASGQPLVIDSRSTGGLDVDPGPDPPVDPDLTLAPDESITYLYEVQATGDGIVGAHTKVTARDPGGVLYEDVHSLRFDIADGLAVTDWLGRYIQLKTMDNFLQAMFGDWYAGMATRGRELHRRLSKVLSPKERKRWFGSKNGLPLTPFDFATALLRGVAPELAAASLPKNKFKGWMTERLDREYNDAFKKEVGKGVADYVNNYKHLAGSVKKGLKDSWSEAMLASFYLFGTATPDERAQFEAYMVEIANGTDTSVDNLVNTIAREVPNWKANATYLDEALDMAVADAFLLSPDLQAQMAQERKWRENLIKLADTDPLEFQRAWAQRDAEIFNLGIPLVLDTLIGGGVTKLGGKLKGAVVRREGAAVMRSGEAAGVLKENGVVAKGPKTAIDPADAAAPRTVPLGDVAEIERTGGYLDNVEGATVVQSSDLGKVYELPNLGGVPETTLDAKAGILQQLEGEYAAQTSKQLKLAEVLKPSSPLRKPNGVAKLELTSEKTGKAAMLDAGAPPDVLAEASVWKSSVHPKDLPGFEDLSKARQQVAIKEWETANARWAEYQNPTPGSKTDRLKQCIGQRTRVPLDEKPNNQGIQRFVTAEFEEVDVTHGQARAKLLRVKYYEVEVFDTKAGRAVNRKTVVDVPEAVPQTPDADGVAMAKVVGTDEAGRPILAPLSREEREFIMPRYIDKNVKARRLPPGSKGAIPDLAEHGVTLVMDDASAKAAGKLLSNYGIPFLPENVGLPFIRRIAPFVAGKGATLAQIEKMYEQMVQIVRTEGGFGQKAVVVTTDSRYFGDIPFASW